jgi:hypothetical protein
VENAVSGWRSSAGCRGWVSFMDKLDAVSGWAEIEEC